MKKITAIFGLLVILMLLVARPSHAQNDRPRALEDKGPLSKITFIHYRDENAKLPKDTSNKSRRVLTCYTFLANGAKWKTVEDYYVNPINGSGLLANFVFNSVNAGVAEWENYGGNIFGTGYLDYAVGFNNGSYDSTNTVSFGNYSDNNVIAVTNVWGYFYGPTRTRELVEWDMLLNNYYVWGDALTSPALMDMQNIVTHELGHAAGMGDLYNSACIQETMYGYAGYGQTNKRDLNAGDIAGIQKLY